MFGTESLGNLESLERNLQTCIELRNSKQNELRDVKAEYYEWRGIGGVD